MILNTKYVRQHVRYDGKPIQIILKKQQFLV
jgi:hypothetical protein